MDETYFNSPQNEITPDEMPFQPQADGVPPADMDGHTQEYHMEYPAENPSDYVPAEQAGYPDNYPPEYPEESPAEYADEYIYEENDAEAFPITGSAYMNSTWANEPGPETEEEDEGPKKHTIFKPRKRKPSFALGVFVNSVRMLVLFVVLLGLAGVGAVVGIAKAYMDSAPTLDLTAIDDQAQTSFIYDAQGNLITNYRGTENRIMVSITSMPSYLQHAFVAVEDARFYTHNGVDVKRIIGAFVTNFTTGSNQGGSTITQQLIKNTLLSSEQSYKRKIQEAYLAMQLETRYNKDQILESYLNTIYLGEDYYGVKVAAMGYFGKDNLHDLTLRECAMLAGMTTNPYYYNPRRNFYTRQSDTTDYAAITNNRTDYVLRCMYENQFISREEYEAALQPQTAHVLEKNPESTALYPYPHYVEYAVRDVVQLLLKANNLENTAANRTRMENKLRTGGYHVYLAIDTDIQKAVENTLYNYDNYPALRTPSDKIYRAKNADGTYDEIIQPQAAAVVMDYRTGEIKAIVGSRTAPTTRKSLNRAADMNMPVGSAIKPIAVYAPAIEMGAGAGSVLYNMPLPLQGWRGADGKDSWPQNYGGSSYRGPETLRTALTKSDNTAAAYALMHMVGVDRSYDFLLRMGVDADNISKTPFGLSLGSSGITPFDMTVAFGVLGNGGVYQSPLTVLGITDSDGTVIYDGHAAQERRQVFKPSTAWLTVDILKDVITNGTGTSAKISGQTVAGKTGTNSDQKGVFFSGLTGYYCASVWIGHDNYKALSSKTTGGNSAAKLWKAFMQPIHQGLANRDIMEGSAADYGLIRVTTCNVSGQRATDACRNDVMGYGTTTDYWPASTAPTADCMMHYTLAVCNESGMLACPYCPSVSNKGVVLLPQGHPLYRFINTKYEDVLVDYLGEYASLKLTGDANYNNTIIRQHACPYHQTGSSYNDYVTQNTLLPDAQRLLTQANQQLAALDPSHWAYANLFDAINNLSSVIYNNPTQEALFSAMSRLTQAMAAAQ